MFFSSSFSQVVDLMLKSLQPDHPVNSMLACKALANLVAAGHPLPVEKVSKTWFIKVFIILTVFTALSASQIMCASCSSLIIFLSTFSLLKVVELLPALLPAASNNLETALASLLSNLSVVFPNHHFPTYRYWCCKIITFSSQAWNL